MTPPLAGHPLFDTAPLAFSDAVAALIVVRQTGRYLMQLRDDKPGIFYPDHWGVFGGAVEAGETPEEALRRELNEELNLTFGDPRYFTNMEFDVTVFGQKKVWRRYYEIDIDEDQIPKLRLGEGRRMEALPVEDLLISRKIVPYDSFAIWMHNAMRTWGKAA